MPTATAPITNGVESSSPRCQSCWRRWSRRRSSGTLRSGAAAVVDRRCLGRRRCRCGPGGRGRGALIRQRGNHDNRRGIFRLAAVRVRRLDPSDLADLARLDDGEEQDLIRGVREGHEHAETERLVIRLGTTGPRDHISGHLRTPSPARARAGRPSRLREPASRPCVVGDSLHPCSIVNSTGEVDPGSTCVGSTSTWAKAGVARRTRALAAVAAEITSFRGEITGLHAARRVASPRIRQHRPSVASRTARAISPQRPRWSGWRVMSSTVRYEIDPLGDAGVAIDDPVGDLVPAADDGERVEHLVGDRRREAVHGRRPSAVR